MPIRVETSGAAELYGGLARLAGESIAAQRDAERAERNAQAMREHQWEMERGQLEHQWDIEAFNRSQSWNIEKMEQASRFDFAREERERQELLDKQKAKYNAIDNAISDGYLSEKEGELMKLQIQTELPLLSTYMKPKKELSSREALLQQLVSSMAETPTEGMLPTTPTTQPTYTGPAPAGGGVLDWIKKQYYGPQYYERTRPTAPVTTTPTTYPAVGTEGEIPLLTGKQVPEEYRRMGVTEYRPPTMEEYRRIVVGQPTGQPTREEQPTPEELRARNTGEAYKQGVRLGYWR